MKPCHFCSDTVEKLNDEYEKLSKQYDPNSQITAGEIFNLDFRNTLPRKLTQAVLFNEKTGKYSNDYSGYGNHVEVDEWLPEPMPRYKWDRKLTQKEIAALEENPWCLFRKVPNYVHECYKKNMKAYLVCWTDSAARETPKNEGDYAQDIPCYVEKIFKTEEAAQKFIDGLDLYPKGDDCKGIYDEPWIDEREINV